MMRDIQMTSLDLIRLAVEMRKAQRQYFKARDNLLDCKTLEKRFDVAAAEYLTGVEKGK